jgi:hypothetical protein
VGSLQTKEHYHSLGCCATSVYECSLRIIKDQADHLTFSV